MMVMMVIVILVMMTILSWKSKILPRFETNVGSRGYIYHTYVFMERTGANLSAPLLPLIRTDSQSKNKHFIRLGIKNGSKYR